MCLAIPARITAVNDLEAVAEVGGANRVISLWFTPEAKPGDYVYVHAGFAISVVDEAEALESLQLLRDLAAAYSEEQLFCFSDDLACPQDTTSGR
jgi:hydrogenase expression/formation protein HypC